MNIALCFTVRNCGKYLPDIFKNIELVKTLNVNVFCIFIYDNCSDNSASLLIEYKNKNKNVIVKMIENTSLRRVTRIAKARNVCLDILYNTLEDISFHMMIDSDDKGASEWNIDTIDKYLHNFDNDDWDCISFNRKGFYDIWALLYEDIKHHCWGYESQSQKVVDYMRNDITKKLSNLDDHTLFTCLSAFNGFGIYKTPLFKNIAYDGEYKNIKTFISDKDINDSVEHLKKHNILDSDTASSTFAGFGEEHCEHLFYHLSAIKEKNARIRISKFIL